MQLQGDEPAEDINVGTEKAELIQLADEYSKMDAEDTVGGVRTRFRYREVPSPAFFVATFSGGSPFNDCDLVNVEH